MKTQKQKARYTRHSPEFKTEALALYTLLGGYGIVSSMSAKGNCYDNAVAESFFHSLKVEAIHGERFSTREAMKRTVFHYIEIDYNRTRLHSSLGYQSPVDYEVQYQCRLAS